MKLLLIVSSVFILCGCQSTQQAILGAYFSGIECIGERCLVYDCEYCDPNSKSISSSVYTEGELRVHPLCKPDCKHCANFRRIYKQDKNEPSNKQNSISEKLAKFENEMQLPPNIEEFLSDTLPLVKNDRRKLYNIYWKEKKRADEILITANNLKSIEAKSIYHNQYENLIKKCLIVSEKYIEINEKIEKLYVTYNTSVINKNSIPDEKINLISKEINSDIDFIENRISDKTYINIP